MVRGEAQFVNFQDTAGGAGGALANRWNGPPLQIARTLSSIRDLAKGGGFVYISWTHLGGWLTRPLASVLLGLWQKS